MLEEVQLAMAEQLAASFKQTDSETSIKAALFAMKNPVYNEEQAEKFAKIIFTPCKHKIYTLKASTTF